MEELGRFYLLSDDDLRGALVVEPVKGLSGKALREVALAERRMDKPLRFRRDLGSKVYDVLATTWIVPFLLSPKVVDVLREGGFTGWDVHPARIELEGGKRVEDHGALMVSGRSGPVDEALSESVTLPRPVPEGNEVPGLRGLLFDPATWDGSDIFTPETTTFVMITDAVREALEAVSPSNLRLERITEIERMKV
jgi:hypothetical protein